MKRYLIMTIGNRDVQILGKPLAEIDPEELSRAFDFINPETAEGLRAASGKGLSIRKAGEFFFRERKRLVRDLKFPILEKCLDFLADEAKVEGRKDLADEQEHVESGSWLKKMFVIYTDQPESAGESFRDKDTCWFFRLMEAKVPEILKIKGIPVETNPVGIKISQGAGEADLVHQLLSDEFMKGKMSVIQPGDRVFLMPKGGMPQVTQALVVNAVLRFRGEVVQIDLNERSKFAVSSRYTRKLWEEVERQKWFAVLETLDFNSLKVLMKSSGMTAGPCWEIACYCAARLHFDLDAAKHHARRVTDTDSPEDRELGRRMLEEIGVLKTCAGRKISELAVNAWLKYLQGDLVDFLSRFYRLVEGVRRKLVQEYLDIPSDKRKGGFRHFREKAESIDDLTAFLSDKRANGRPITLDDPNNINLGFICDFIQSLTDADPKPEFLLKPVDPGFVPLNCIIRMIDGLNGLRNNSIAAHGFEGISVSKIEDSLGKKVEEFYLDLASILGLEVESSIYHEARKRLLK